MNMTTILAAFFGCCVFLAVDTFAQKGMSLRGAWQHTAGTSETTMICSEKFFSVSIYEVKNKKFK